MFSSSNDILNLVLSICLISLTFFLCWAIYYFIASVQRIYNLIKRVERGVCKAEEILDIVNDKIKNSAAFFMVLGELFKKFVNFTGEKTVKKTKQTK